MKRNSLNVFIKYLIGASLALIAVSNCFNVLSNSSSFVASPSSDVSRAEAAKPGAPDTTSSSVRDKLDGGSYPFLNSPLNSANGRSTTPLAGLRTAGIFSPVAASLTATKTDNLSTPVNPGATIMYTVEITNTGTVNLTNVNFTDTVDANTTLDMASIKVAPIAVNDTYNTIGNVNIDVPAPGLLGNDLNPNGSGTLSIQSPPTTSTNGGAVSINTTTGAFTYDPPLGFEGSDTFTYTLANSATPGKTDTATVTITVSGMIWFINNNAGACSSSCDGRLSHPFTSIAAFQGVNNGSGSNPAAGDNIFLYSSGTNYTGPLTLLNTQKLIGQGAPDPILTITGLSAPSGNNLLPNTNGTDPVITGTNITAITLGQNNQLHGFTVGNTGATGIDILGANIGNSPGLTVKDVTVNGSGKALDLASGTIVSGSTFATVESTGGSPAEGVRLNTVGGSFTITTTNIVNPTGTGIDVQSSTVAAGGFNFGATTVNKGASSGTGVNLNANTGTIAFSSLAVTTNSGTGVSATSSGTVNVTTGSIAATGGPALVVNPTTLGMTFTTVTSTNSSTTGISLTSASGSLAITTTSVTNSADIGIHVQSLAAMATANFGTTTVSTTGAGDAGIDLVSNGGTITFGATSSVTGAGGTAFNVNAGNAAISYTGNITQNTAGQRAVNVDGITGGSVGISGTVTSSSTAGGVSSTGVNINNANGNVSFTTLNIGTSGTRTTSQAVTITNGNSTSTYNLGAVSIFTNNANGIVSTNFDGTLNVTSGSVDTSSGGSAINIDGPAGLTSLGITLQSVSSSGGTSTGVFIQDAAGSFTAQGGTISNKTGADGSTTTGIGVFLSNVTNITLSNMTLTDFQNYGIRGLTVSGFTMDNCTVDVTSFTTNGTSAASDEASVSFGTRAGTTGLTGTAMITNSTIRRGYEDNFSVFNWSGTLNPLTIDNCIIKDINPAAIDGNDGVVVEAHGTSNVSVDVKNSQFIANRGDHFQATADDSAILDVKFGKNGANTLTGGHPNPLGQSITVNSGGLNCTGFSGLVTFNISNNSINGAVDTPINVNKGGGTTASSFDGRITNNMIGTSGVANSGTTGNKDAIRAVMNGCGTYTAVIANNIIKQVSGNGIFAIARDGDGSGGSNPGDLNLTITGNNLSEPNPGNNAIRIEAGATGTDRFAVCADIGGAGALANTVSGDWGVPVAADEIRLRHQFSALCTFRLPGFVGVSPTDVPAYLTGRNNGFPPGTASATVAGGGAYTGGAACSQPTTMSLHAGEFATSSVSQISDDDISDRHRASFLRAARGEGPYDQNDQKLRAEELAWMVQSALSRWAEVGISTEDLARLQAVTFEVASLPKSELATLSGNTVKIDELAAGYGWFFDQSPLEEGEFQVPVPGKELQTTDLSPAHGKMDLLTVVMRQLGQVYVQGKDRIPESMQQNLQPLMEGTLLPGVRRLPLDQWRVTPRTTGSIKPSADDRLMARLSAQTQPDANPPSNQHALAQTESNGADVPATQGIIPGDARYAVFNPATVQRTLPDGSLKQAIFSPSADLMPGRYGRSARRMSFGPSARPVPASAAATFGGGMVNLGPFTIPPGEKIVIMFSVTVNNPLPNGVCSVSNQGTVTSTEVASTLTDDPDAMGSANPTVTQVVSPPSFTACQTDIMTNTDPGVCTATRSFTATATGCPAPTVACTIPGPMTITSPYAFPKGTTTVTCTAANGQAPDATCMFTVTVTDNEAPVLANCTNKAVNTDPGECSAVVTFTPAVTASDNCDGSLTANCAPASGSTFPKGVTTVVCTATDSSMNQGMCSFTVTVSDNQAPVFTCPPSGGAFSDMDCLPSQDSAYTVATYYSAGSNSVTNAVLHSFTTCTAPPVAGQITINFNATFAGDYSTGGPATRVQAPATGSMRVTFNSQSGNTRLFDTEMLSLDLSGGSLPAGVMLRESPTLASTGRTTITTAPGGFHIDSFFDIFVELSTDGGMTWTPGTMSHRISTVQATDPNQCTAVVNYDTPTATDNCDGTVPVTCNPTSGSTFPKGTTTVTCMASDSVPNQGSCTFTVTVVDTQLPGITCPANINVTGNTCQVINYTTPTPTDNCPMPTASCSPASGTCFAVGTTTVTCTATDMSMNTNTCSFTVTVTPCEITCPSNIIANVAPGTCAQTVKYSDPTTTGMCGTVTCTPASGSSFPKGVNTVTCTTTAGPSCTFTVTINDNESPTISCPANVNQGTDNGVCSAVVNYTTPTGADNCPLPPNAVVCTPASGSVFPKGTTTVGCTVTDGAGLMASCMFTVTVFDDEAPVFAGCTNRAANTDPNLCTAVVNFTGLSATDNCDGMVAVNCNPASGSAFPKGITTVMCSASDTAKPPNTANCTFTVTVSDAQPPTITCPPSGGAFAASDCLPSDRLAYTAATYYSAGSNSMTNAVLRGFSTCTAPPAAGPPITINFTATFVGDYSTGGPATRVQAPATGSMRVTFNNQTGGTRTFDTEMLQLDLTGGSLPANTRLRESPTLASTGQTMITAVSGGFHIDSFFDIFVELSTDGGMTWTPGSGSNRISAVQATDPNQCSAVVNYSSPAVSDNCPGVGAPACNPASGSTFAKGTTTVTCSGQDASSNPNSCMFTVTVVDTQAPSMTCPANISVIDNACHVVNYTTPTATDNCPGVGTVTCDPASGFCFPVGTTTVTCSVSDAMGNQTNCSFTVQVIPCTIMCPPNQTVNNTPGQCGANVNYPAPTTTGQCGTVTCTPAAGSFFPKGTTTVNCTTKAGPSCSFTVTVNDNQGPTFTGCTNRTVSTDANVCQAVVNYTVTATDNCDGPRPVVCVPASGSTFPKGTTTVTCTSSDANSPTPNMSTCMFTVTVNDTQPPSITCPANVTSVTPNIGGTSAVVTYPNPTASDNCPGVTAACNPPSGSTFPTGCTTVTCTATDTSGNTATCTFQVCVFNVCLQDDSNPNNRILINTQTGDYRFCCNGVTYTGKGKITQQGSTFTLEHNSLDRRVRATVTGSAHSGTATIQSPPGTTRCNITDSNTSNNTTCSSCL